MPSDPVEVTTSYVTTVDDLTTAWAFVMAHIDTLGPDPHIDVAPVTWDHDSDQQRRRFEVSVSGMVQKEADE